MRIRLATLAVLLAFPASAQTVPVPDKRPASNSAVEQSQPAATAPEAAKTVRREYCPALRLGLVTGKQLPPIVEGDCGTGSPLAITSAGGIALAGEVVLTCGMATALAQFVPLAQKLALDVLGSPLDKIEGGNGYECRNRNRAASGKLSEHAFANAYDIAAFLLKDGRRISVGGDWPHLVQLPPAAEKPAAPQTRATTLQAKFLTGLHAASCGLFSTVLGPDENAEHREHFHLDLGCHGKDCTYYICN